MRSDARTWRYTEGGNKIIPYYVTSTVVRVRMYPGSEGREEGSRGTLIGHDCTFLPFTFHTLAHPDLRRGILLAFFSRAGEEEGGEGEFFRVSNSFVSSLTRMVALRFFVFSLPPPPPLSIVRETWKKFGIPRFGAGKTRNLIFLPEDRSSLGNCSSSWNEFFWIELIFPFRFSFVGKVKAFRFRYSSRLAFVSRKIFFFLFESSIFNAVKIDCFFERERENLVFRDGYRGTFSEVSRCLNLHSTRSMSPFRRRYAGNSLPDQIRTATLEIQISIKRNVTSKDLISIAYSIRVFKKKKKTYNNLHFIIKHYILLLHFIIIYYFI